MTAKPAWTQVKLRVAWGDVPEFTDILQCQSGRRYQVIGVKGRTLQTLVLPADAPTDGAKVIPWMWAPRRRKVA